MQTAQLQCGSFITSSIFSKILTKHPVGARYGVRGNSEMCSDMVNVVLYAISYHARQHYYGTTLYFNIQIFLDTHYNFCFLIQTSPSIESIHVLHAYKYVMCQNPGLVTILGIHVPYG